MAQQPIKFHTAPSRLRKRDTNVWEDLHAMIDAVDTAQHHPQQAATLSGVPPQMARFGEGGSWSRQFKRRTSEEGSSMSLWEVSEALSEVKGPASAPRAQLPATADESFGLADLDALQALVDVEESEMTEQTADASADDLNTQGFVDAVFGDGLPELTLARTETTETVEEEHLQDDMLLAMLRTDGQPWDLTKFALEGPESPSPTSVTALFGEALSGDVSPTDSDAVPGRTEAFHAALTHRLEVRCAAGPEAPGVLRAMPLPLPLPSTSQLGNSRNGAERKEWTAAEDEIIHSSVVIHGCKWRKIAALLPGRSDDAVRNRWNRLKEQQPVASPPLATGEAPAPVPKRSTSEGGNKPERVSWTKAEDATILSSVAELGHKWNKLAERLPGRTDHAIRNRFHRLQTMMEDKQRAQQRFFAPAEPLPSVPTTPLVGFD